MHHHPPGIPTEPDQRVIQAKGLYIVRLGDKNRYKDAEYPLFEKFNPLQLFFRGKSRKVNDAACSRNEERRLSSPVHVFLSMVPRICSYGIGGEYTDVLYCSC